MERTNDRSNGAYMSQPEITTIPSFLHTLRERTNKSHTALEANPASVALLQPEVNLATYQYYLAAMYGMKKACEDQVFPWLQDLLPDLDSRKKADLIVADLSHTGYTPEQLAQLPVYRFSVPDIATALGIMYVLEGSTLGGRVLYQHVQKTLGFGAGAGASYFCGYGTETAAKWRLFLPYLVTAAEDDNAGERIIAAAIHAFTETDRWLSGTSAKPGYGN